MDAAKAGVIDSPPRSLICGSSRRSRMKNSSVNDHADILEYRIEMAFPATTSTTASEPKKTSTTSLVLNALIRTVLESAGTGGRDESAGAATEPTEEAEDVARGRRRDKALSGEK